MAPTKQTSRTATKAKRTVRAVSLDEASPSRQKKLFQALRRTMQEHGVRGELAGLILTRGTATVSEGPPRRRAISGCPPGQVKRVVCVRRPNGSVMCRTECQPI